MGRAAARWSMGRCSPEDAAEFLAAALGDHPAEDAARWLIGARTPTPGIPSLTDHPFWGPQERRLMRVMGMIDPESIDEAIAEGAYAALDRAVTMEPMAICDLVLSAGVGGRGGGGFPAGQKWKFLLGAPGPTKYLVCNADEGDPGAFVNRVLMESDPHLVIEGMAIAGKATGADYGFIYIRDEYPLSIERMQLALDQARERGLLGSDIFGSGFDFDLEITRGRRIVRLRRGDRADCVGRGDPRDAQDPSALPGPAGRVLRTVQRQQHRNLRQRAPDRAARRRLVPAVRDGIGPRHEDVLDLRRA